MNTLLSSHTLCLASAGTSPVTDVAARLRGEAETVLRDVAFVLHLARQMKADLLSERTNGSRLG